MRDLLRSWHRPTELSRHPFMRLRTVEALSRQQGLDPADALRQAVREAIEIAWPRDELASRAQRKRQLIEAHYWQDIPLKSLAQAMHMDVRTVRRLAAEALDDLADALSELEKRAQAEPTSASPTIFLAPPLATHPLLIGRAELLTRLVDALQPTGRVVALNGLPGSGKTAMLTHAARHPAVRQRFPDGVLWADLSSGTALDSTLYQWGIALGLTQPDLRRMLGEEALLSALIRSALEARRLLIILNDASSLDRVKKLLLGGPGCCHLVASAFPDLTLQLCRRRAYLCPLSRQRRVVN